jgi:hypothetical protein
MRVMKPTSAIVMLVLIAAVTSAEDKKPNPPITWATTLPAIELSNQPLEKVLGELKQKLPGFDFSISRENVPHDYPVLPDIRVENISLSEFVRLIQDELPGVTIRDKTEGNPSLFLNANGDGTLVLQVDIGPNPNTPGVSVRVFGLSDIVAYRASLLKGDGDHAKQATDDILSLIQAALDEADSSVKPHLKIHPPTETLICKVTKDQGEVIEQVLAALRPTEAQLRLVEEQQQHQVLQEVEKINSDAATTATTSPTTKPAK